MCCFFDLCILISSWKSNNRIFKYRYYVSFYDSAVLADYDRYKIFDKKKIPCYVLHNFQWKTDMTYLKNRFVVNKEQRSSDMPFTKLIMSILQFYRKYVTVDAYWNKRRYFDLKYSFFLRKFSCSFFFSIVVGGGWTIKILFTFLFELSYGLDAYIFYIETIFFLR